MIAEENFIIHKIFSEIALRFPERVALQIKRDGRWLKFTYRDTETLSLKVATFLVKEGFRKSDFAGIVLENRPEWGIIYLGIMYAGLTAVPLDPQLNVQELKNLIIDSSAKIIFCSDNIFSEKIKENLGGHLNKIVLLDAGDEKAPNSLNFLEIENISPSASILPEVSPEDIASLIYTSGTTAKPKGVLLSHKNISSNFKSIDKLNLCFSSDNVLSLLPLYHTYAFMVTLIVPLFLGAKVTYCWSFKPQDLGQIIKEVKISILVGVPQLFAMLHKAIFERIRKIPLFLRLFILPLIKTKVYRQFGRSLRLLVSGGARLQPKMARELSQWLGVKLVEGYGLTETSPVVTINPPQKIKFGSVGKAIPEVEIKIFNPDKSAIGEVLIKGPNVMQGYFRQPDLTLEVIKGGWFYSGDLGYIDKDGYLFLTGREKEMIVLSSGKNIYPEELEEYYSQSPYIKEICILAKQEETFGRLRESLYAIIVPNLEIFKQKNETDIRGKIRWELENLSKNLPAYKHIMGFMVTREELPRTALKKLKRYQVRKKYLEEKLPEAEIREAVFSEEDRKILNQDAAQKIINYISGELHKPAYLDSHLEMDLGVDSLTRVELGIGLEALLKIKIPDELFYRISTVKEAVISILEIINKSPRIPTLEAEGITQKNWYQILREAPTEAILKKIRIQAGLLDKLLTWIFKNTLLFIFRIFWDLKIKGKEFLPRQGPCLICPNHASYLDGFAVFSSLPLRQSVNIFFLGYRAIFEHPLVSWSVKIARLISVDPATHLTEAMQAVSFVLKHKKIVCIFPEGRRSIDDNIGEFKKGIGILIKELDIPVVPVYIKGSHYTWPRGSRLPRFYPLRIIFGQPVSLKELIKTGKDQVCTDDYEAVAKGLRKEVLKLRC